MQLTLRDRSIWPVNGHRVAFGRSIDVMKAIVAIFVLVSHNNERTRDLTLLQLRCQCRHLYLRTPPASDLPLQKGRVVRFGEARRRLSYIPRATARCELRSPNE